MKTTSKDQNKRKKKYPKYYPAWLIAMIEDQDYCELFW